MSLRIYKSILCFILFFHVAFINLYYINGYRFLQYILMLVVGAFLLSHLKIFRYSKLKKINKIIFLYIIMVLVSSFLNRNLEIERQVFYVAIVFSVVVIEAFFLLQYFIIKRQTKELINILFYLLLFYCLLTDIIIILFPKLHIINDMYYFTGNKFEVSYLHIQLLIIYLQREKRKLNFLKFNKKDFIFTVLVILSFTICFIVKCTTGMIGVFLLIYFYYYFSYFKAQKLKKPEIFIGILFISSTILLLFSNIIEIGPIRYLVEDVFHKDITLTGRLNIYQKIDSLFSKFHIIFGYGMGSSFEVAMKMIGAPNTQNGVLEIILQQGIISLSLLIILIWQVLKYSCQNKSINYALIMLYIYILFTSVEITLDISFLIWLALLLVFENNSKRF